MNKSLKILLWILIVSVSLAAFCLILYFQMRPPEVIPPVVQETTVPTTTAAPETAPATTAAPEITADEDFLALLAESGRTLQELTDMDCRQLVTVAVTDATAQIRFYYLEDNRWQLEETLVCSGYVGKRGATDQKREGDLATPRGLFHISDAFYMNTAPTTGLHVFQITQDTYWVDDPNSVYYNKRVEGTGNKDWNSAEHMSRYGTAYEYGFVVDYNTECVPGAGSAIFFHVGSSGTAGCIATDREFVLAYLEKLDQSCNPHILIF